jgi:hypothetical protein
MVYSNILGQVRVGVRSAQQLQNATYLLSSQSLLTTPLLDNFTEAGAAYSLRKVRSAYTGFAIRVRRSSDNGEQNIGFDGSGNLDTTSLLSFVGSGSGFVTTWYDQSGNSKDAQQSTASRQPNIVINGTLRTQGTRPSFYFDGVDDYFDCGYVNGGIKPGTFSTWISANITDASQSRAILSSGNSGGQGITGYNQFGIHSSIGYKMFGVAGDGDWVNNTESGFYRYYSTATAPATNQRYLFEQHYVSNSASTSYVGQFWWNDIRQSVSNWFGSAVKSSGPEYKTSIGRAGENNGGYLQGMVQEIITYFNDKTSVRKEIVSNINTYYAIYTQDANPIVAAAYSLRKLKGDYTGSAIRVRRSSDNAEQNIGFDSNGGLDQTALSEFAGSNNSFLYSENFDNAYWTKTGVSITTNQGTAPDGTQTADLFQETAGSGVHYLNTSYSSNFGLSASWNMSLYIKKDSTNTATNNRIMIRQSKNDYNDGGTTAVFNLDTGQVVYTADGNVQGGTLGIIGATMSNQGNGWWRCSMWGKRPLSTWGAQSGQVSVAIGKAPLTDNWGNVITGAPGYQISWNGDTSGKYLIWGIQLTFKTVDDSYQSIKPYTKTTTTYPGSAYVTTWFDQSGNGRNLTQATAINQPPIIEDCTIVKLNSKPVISFLFNGTTRRWLGMTWGSMTMNPPFSMFLNMKIQSTVYDFNIISGLENNKRFGISSFSVGNYAPSYTFWGSDNNYIGGNVANNNNSIHYVYTSTSENTVLGLNGTSTTKYITPASWRAIQIGTSDTGQFYAPELIFFYGNKSSTRSTIESNINSYYSVY